MSDSEDRGFGDEDYVLLEADQELQDDDSPSPKKRTPKGKGKIFKSEGHLGKLSTRYFVEKLKGMADTNNKTNHQSKSLVRLRVEFGEQ